MTREESKKAAEVMLAYAEGKKIEYKVRGGEEWHPIGELETPQFGWNSKEYRIAQEPTYRPFKNAKECWAEMLKHQPFGWVRSGNFYQNIGELNGASVHVDDIFPYKDAFDEFTFIDGTPFGLKEE